MSKERFLLLEILGSSNSRENALKTKELVIRSPEAREAFVSILLNDKDQQCQRASYALGLLADDHTEIVFPFIKKLIDIYLSETRHPSFGRNLLRVVERLPIDFLDDGLLVEKCVSNLIDSTISVAEKAFSIGILDRLTHVYPILAQEVIPLLKQALPYQTPAFVGRAKKYIQLHNNNF